MHLGRVLQTYKAGINMVNKVNSYILSLAKFLPKLHTSSLVLYSDVHDSIQTLVIEDQLTSSLAGSEARLLAQLLMTQQ